MNIIFIDKLWQIEQLENYSKKIIVSLKPNCSYILERKNIEYIDYSSLYNHQYEWKNYVNYNSNIETIVKNLGKYFFEVKSNYKFLNWNLFDDFSYIIKIWYDTLFFHSKFLEQIISKYNPDVLEFSSKTSIGINEEGLIDDSVNIIEHLAKSNLKIKIVYNKNIRLEKSNVQKFSFGQPKYFFKKIEFLGKLKKIFNRFYTIYILKFKKIDYLAIGCDEISFFNNFKKLYIKNIYPEKKEQIVSNENNFSSIINIILKNNFLNYEKINFSFFFIEILNYIYSRSDFYYNEYIFYNNLIKKKK